MNTGIGTTGRRIDPRHQMAQEDVNILRAIRRIVGNGNNVEIRQTAEGKLRVFEVSKKIAKDC